MTASSDPNDVLAVDAGVLGKKSLATPLELQKDALTRDGEAALTCVLFGFTGAIQSEAYNALRLIDKQDKYAGSEFFRAMTLFLGRGSLKFSDLFVRLSKLTNEVRQGALSVDDGLLRLDYLIVEFGACLTELRPVSRFNGTLDDAHDVDHGRHGALEFGHSAVPGDCAECHPSTGSSTQGGGPAPAAQEA